MYFSYLLEKIKAAEISTIPFRHLQINDFFKQSDFEKIISCKEIRLASANNDQELFARLFDASYKIIEFPGCTINQQEYIKWHRHKTVSTKINTACEGFGTVLRLTEPQSDIIQELNAFLNSEEFITCLAERFGIDQSECIYDAGIQKYLDGYEISPHPDVRRKALTYMVNINPDPASDNNQHHTSYLNFAKKFKFVEAFWQGNENLDRCWVPWDWCEVQKTQTENNSIVIFSPSNNTLHAVKADYNHLNYQRTQLYGNLWYPQVQCDFTPPWESLAFPVVQHMQKKNTLLQLITHPFKLMKGKLNKPKITDRTHAVRKHNGQSY